MATSLLTEINSNMNVTDICLRRATVEDADLLSQISVRTFIDSYTPQLDRDALERFALSVFSPDAQRAELADAAHRCFLAQREGQIVGYAALHDGAAPAEIGAGKALQLTRIYVLEDYIGQGIGAVLMRHCISEASQSGYEKLWLGVWEHNVRAQIFYRRWGFQPVGSIEFMFGEEAQTDLLLSLDLTEAY